MSVVFLPTLAVSNKKIDALLAKTEITLKDLESFSQREREHMEEVVTNMLAELKGTERDSLLQKMEQFVSPETKNIIWEDNHMTISGAISNFMNQKGMMPTKSALARKTGLSRQTVARHLAAYKQHPEFKAEMEQFEFMSHKILAIVF